MFVLIVLAVFNVSFLTYTMFIMNFASTQEGNLEGRSSILDNGSWRSRMPLFGKSVEIILDQLSHGPQPPVFLYKPVCRSGVCTRYSGLELKRIFRENGFNIVDKSDKDWTVSLTNGVSGVPKVSKVILRNTIYTIFRSLLSELTVHGVSHRGRALFWYTQSSDRNLLESFW